MRLLFTATPGDHDQPSARQQRKKNPLLCDAFGLLFFDIESNSNSNSNSTNAPGSPLALRNPSYFGPRDLVAAGLAIADMRDGRRRHRAFVRKGASWRRMLGCQPPVTRVRYKYSGDGSRDIHVEGAGLRMGPLYDLVFGILYGGDLQHGDGRAVWIGWKPAVFGTQTTWPGGSPWALATRRVRRRHCVALADGSLALNYDDDGDDYDYDDEVEAIVRAVRKSRGRGGKYSRYNRYPGHVDDRADYLRTRSRTGSQWMFQCEDFEDINWEFVDKALKSLFGDNVVILATK